MSQIVFSAAPSRFQGVNMGFQVDAREDLRRLLRRWEVIPVDQNNNDYSVERAVGLAILSEVRDDYRHRVVRWQATTWNQIGVSIVICGLGMLAADVPNFLGGKLVGIGLGFIAVAWQNRDLFQGIEGAYQEQILRIDQEITRLQHESNDSSLVIPSRQPQVN